MLMPHSARLIWLGDPTPECAQLAKTPKSPTNWEVIHVVLGKRLVRLVKPLARNAMRAPHRVTGTASDGSRGVSSLTLD